MVRVVVRISGSRSIFVIILRMSWSYLRNEDVLLILFVMRGIMFSHILTGIALLHPFRSSLYCTKFIHLCLPVYACTCNIIKSTLSLMPTISCVTTISLCKTLLNCAGEAWMP